MKRYCKRQVPKILVLLLVLSPFISIFTLSSPVDEGPLVYPSGETNYAYDTIPLPATNIEANTATLNGWYGWGGTLSATVGFLYSDVFPIATTNVSVSGTFTNQSFSKHVSGLNASTCYYFTVWCNNLTSPFWYRSYLNESFLSRPSGPPQNLTIAHQGDTNITLTWDNVTDWQNDSDLYQETIIRYSNTSQPTSPTSGTLGYQGTDETVNIIGLDRDTQYYFSAWTHIYKNCSWNASTKICHQNSSEFSTATASTQGGRYNITIRYENRTYGPVNLTRYGPHKMVLYYYGQNLTDYYGQVSYIIFNNNATDFEDYEIISNPSVNKTVNLTYTPSFGITVSRYNNSTSVWEVLSSSFYTYLSGPNQVNISASALDDNTTYVKVEYGTLETYVVEHDPMAYIDINVSNASQGKISFSVNKTIKFIDFHWNDSDANINRCNRVILTEPKQRDYDIFIRDDLPVYLEGTGTMNHSLVKYMLSFSDETGKFTIENDARAYIYTFDDDDNKLIIHSEYLDEEMHINPWLVYEKRYFIGVSCSEFSYERIAVFTSADNQAPEIRIPYYSNYTYSFYNLISIDRGWHSNGFYVVYEDTTYTTDLAVFKVYGMSNGTLLDTQTTTNSYKNFTYNGNVSWNYYWEITTILDDPADEYDGTYTSGKIPVFGGMEPIISNETIDEVLEIILGPSPMFYSGDYYGGGDHPDSTVPWAYIAVFAICFVWLTTLGKLNSSIAGLGVGGILLFSGTAISISTLYSDTWYNGATLVIIGVFVIAVSLIMALGGVEK